MCDLSKPWKRIKSLNSNIQFVEVHNSYMYSPWIDLRAGRCRVRIYVRSVHVIILIRSKFEFKYSIALAGFIRLLLMHIMPKLARPPFVSTEMFILVSWWVCVVTNSSALLIWLACKVHLSFVWQKNTTM